jgi:hypothetical protein
VKTCFLTFLKNCLNVIALLHYNNQAAAVVDYIMFKFDNLLKKAAIYGVKNLSVCSGTDQKNKYICLLLKTKV